MPITPTILKAAVGLIDEDVPEIVETPAEVIEPIGMGLMSQKVTSGEASPDEQARMLGLVETEEEDAVQ